jgi:hypothetical protein
MLGHEGQDTTLALDGQAVCGRDDLNRVNVPARKAINQVEHLERSHQIELINWRHHHDDDQAARGVATHARFLICGSHAFSYYAAGLKRFARLNKRDGGFRRICVVNRLFCSARIPLPELWIGHTVDLEAGYIRHLDWHRQAKDTFNWYSYSVWASTERQRWIIYATFGHTAAELGNPVSPAEDERDNLINVLPHSQFLGNRIYEFLPAPSRGSGVPTPTLRAEYTTVELNYGTGKVFEAALAAEQSKLQGETLWYRLVVGGNTPRYVCLPPRTSLTGILDERVNQSLPDKVNGWIAKIIVETLNFRTNMLVNVTPEPAR